MSRGAMCARLGRDSVPRSRRPFTSSPAARLRSPAGGCLAGEAGTTWRVSSEDSAEEDAAAGFHAAGRPLVALLRASHLLAPDSLASAAAEHARTMGVQELVLYLADYEQVTLLPLPG